MALLTTSLSVALWIEPQPGFCEVMGSIPVGDSFLLSHYTFLTTNGRSKFFKISRADSTSNTWGNLEIFDPTYILPAQFMYLYYYPIARAELGEFHPSKDRVKSKNPYKTVTK